MRAARVLLVAVSHRIPTYHAPPGKPGRRAGFACSARRVDACSGKRPMAGSPSRDEASRKQARGDDGRRAGQDDQNDPDCVRPALGEDDQNHAGERNESGEGQKPPSWPPKPPTLPFQLGVRNRCVIVHQCDSARSEHDRLAFRRNRVIARTKSAYVSGSAMSRH